MNPYKITLTDGRQMAYNEYGDPGGFPVIALHGTPGSRVWFSEDDPISINLNVRLITIDRPGYGLSDPNPNHSIKAYSEDITELVSSLGLKKYSVFGVSGGGAFALSCAVDQDKRLFKVGLVASIYEFENGKPPRDMCRPNKVGFFLAKRFPFLLKFNFNQQRKLLLHKPELYKNSINKNTSHLCEADQKVLNNENSVYSMYIHMKEAFIESANSPVQEMALFSQNWGLDFANINCPVEIWHGEDDSLSPIAGMKKFAQDIKHKNLHYLDSKGHFLDEDEEIWEGILKSMIPG